VTNLVRFSEELDLLAVEMQQAVSTNKFELSAAVQEYGIDDSHPGSTLKRCESGKGLAGALMRDDTLRVDLRQIAAKFFET